jgi:hypothetical protein
MVALPLLVLVVALVFGVPIAVALAGSGMLVSISSPATPAR